jgi:hypothetical protein
VARRAGAGRAPPACAQTPRSTPPPRRGPASAADQPGKFLIESSGKFYAWRTDVTGAPHHAVAAEMLGVESWVIDGVVDADGAWWQTARVPDADHLLLIERAMPRARALGLGRLV